MIRHDDIKSNISSKHCRRCGGEGDGFKCPKCGHNASHYDPLHWKHCLHSGKPLVKCKKCGKVEDSCMCSL